MTRTEQLQCYRVNEATGCHEWTKRCRPVDGYGEFFGSGRKQVAHRAAYEEYKGEIPKGLLVRHSCDNPPCINPAHLLLGTDQDNANDKVARGRHRTDTMDDWRRWLSEYDIKLMAILYRRGMHPKQIIKQFNINWRGWSVVKQSMQSQ